MSIKMYKSLLGERGAKEQYATVSENLQDAASEMNAICYINTKKAIVTLISQSEDYVKQAHFDFSGNVIQNGITSNIGIPMKDGPVRPFDEDVDFHNFQLAVQDNMGPYVLIKIALSGDDKLLENILQNYSASEKMSFYKDLEVLKNLIENPDSVTNIEKSQNLIQDNPYSSNKENLSIADLEEDRI